jgi:hypothetical protein
MRTLKVNIPGPGGSLGECVLCGKDFAFEVITGKSVDCVRISGFDRELPIHAKCGNLLKDLQGHWEEIRTKFPHGPLYDCFEAEFTKERSDYER